MLRVSAWVHLQVSAGESKEDRLTSFRVVCENSSAETWHLGDNVVLEHENLKTNLQAKKEHKYVQGRVPLLPPRSNMRRTWFLRSRAVPGWSYVDWLDIVAACTWKGYQGLGPY